jgi:hypothetical protein
MMKKLLFSLQFAVFTLCISTVQAQNWNQILKATASDREDKNTSGRSSLDYFGKAVAIAGDLAIIGAPGETEDENGQNRMIGVGAAYIFQKIGGEWKFVRKLHPNVRQPGQHFGSTVSISSQYASVGSEDSKSVFIYKKDNGGPDSWEFIKKLTPTNLSEESGFGGSLSMGGFAENLSIAVGARGDEEVGAVYIFSKDKDGPENWGLVKKITAPSPQANSQFGVDISLNGDSLLVGSSGDNSDESQQNELTGAGAAYIFHRDKDGSNNWGFLKKLVAPTRIGSAAFGSSVDINGRFLIIGSPLDDQMPDFTSAYGAAYIFENSQIGTTDWIFTKKLIPSIRQYGDAFGSSVSIGGSYAVVGSAHEDQDQSANNIMESSGSGYIFYRNQNGFKNWGEVRKVTPQPRAEGDLFGVSVAISRDNIVFGAMGESEDQFENKTLPSAGAAYFHNYSVGGNNFWGQTQKVVASSSSISQRYYGKSVSISGDYAIVGSNDYRTGTTSGHKGPVYILYNNGVSWKEVKRIDPPLGMINDNFGSSVAINGNYAVVGATDSNNKFFGGQWTEATCGVYLFEKDKGGIGNWGLVKQLEPTRYQYDRYGYSLSVGGDYIAVGAPRYPSNNTAPNDYPGAVFLFQKDFGGSNNWGQLKMITSLFLANGDGFGASVSINDDNLLIGASGEGHDVSENNFILGAGAAYLFEKNFGGNNNWGQKQKVTAPVRYEYQNFGSSVAINGNNLIVGAPNERYDVNNSNYVNLAGAAYIFKKNSVNGLWTNIKKVTAETRSEFKCFGFSVGISGNNAVVGNGLEYYDRTGNSYPTSWGSAWVFSKDKNGFEAWGQTQEISAQYRYPEDHFGYSVAISGKYILAGAPYDDRDYKEENWLTNTGSAYIFKSTDAALPVTLSLFEAIKTENQSLLKWATTEETSSDYFDLQKSRDGYLWESLKLIKANEESSSLKTYSYTDVNPYEGENLYRLKMVDKDGSFAFSRIRSLSFGNKIALKLYPNPTSDRLLFPVATDLSQIESVQLVNGLGRVVFESKEVSKDGISVRNFSPGVYTVRIKKVDERVEYQKILVVR